MEIAQKVRRNINLLTRQFHNDEFPPSCQITPALKEKLRSIGYEESQIPHVVRALCFQTYRKKPKKGYRYLMLGVDEFGLVDCGGDYNSEIIPLTILQELRKRPQESDWKWVYIFDAEGNEVLREQIK